MTAPLPKPLAGLLVIDMSQGIAGPYVGMLAARFGADVVKVEPPEGDWVRKLSLVSGPHSAMSAFYNQGKRSICLNLKDADDLALFRAMAAAADAVIESARPGAADRLGVGYDALAAGNPGLIYVSISGFGSNGPYAARPCTDTVAQAFSGLMSLNRGTDGLPHKIDVTVIDVLCGLYGYQALTMALMERRATGAGRLLDVSLMQAAAEFMAPRIIENAVLGHPSPPPAAPSGTYRTADHPIALIVVRQAQFERLCPALGAPELLADPRYADPSSRVANREALDAALTAVLETRPRDHWLRVLAEADVLANAVNDLGDWLADPHVLATEAAPTAHQPGMGEIRVPAAAGFGGDAYAPSPAPDEHRAEILARFVKRSA